MWRTESDAGPPGEALASYLHDEMVPTLAGLGFDCVVHPNPDARGGPILVARRIEDAALPTVLTYGHGDVVSGQESKWRAGLDPWRLSIEGQRWYGRGTADNKGQHSINFAGLQHTLAARGGKLGYNVTALLEMGEEAGSPGLASFCSRHKDLLRADLLIACDGPRVAADRPTLFLGSRGGVNFTLQVKSRERAYHSGNWGGVLVNPATVLAHALASLVDAKGRLLVEGLRPAELPDQVRQALENIRVSATEDDPQVDDSWGEPGLSAMEKLVGWNTLEILAMESGSPQRPINAIPATATAFCQLRFVVGTDWQQLEVILRDHLNARGFGMVDIRVTFGAPATRLDLNHPWVAWAVQSMQASSDRAVALLPNLAGSLPNDIFAEGLDLPTLWVPHSYPACAQHAPNEHLLADVAREGLQIMGGLYWDLGQPQGLPWHPQD